jgi:ABC-type nickel/cobalt efflux system permease component RcnA
LFSGPLIVALAASALAHPLATRNFDCAAQVRAGANKITIHYELVVSELTLTTELLKFHESGQIPADGQQAAALYAETIFPVLEAGLILSVDESRVELTPGQASQSRSDHVYLSFEMTAPITVTERPATIELLDTNFEGEPGYRRLAVDASPPVSISSSNVPRKLADVSLTATWELTPEEEEARTHSITTVQIAGSTAFATATEQKPAARAIDATTAPPAGFGERHLRDLLSAQGKGLGFWAAVLVGAFGLGMVHAIKPGHGKTLVAAYLVGQHGTVWHAILLGIVMTLTHTGSVLFVALLLRPFAGTQWVEQGMLSYWLTLLSGVLVAALGLGLLWRRWHGEEDLLHKHGPGGHSHLPDGSVVWHDGSSGHHSHTHHHGHGSVHHHGPDDVSLSSLVTLGFSGGLVPCDDAVVLLLAAIGAGILGQAIYLLLAFSGGLAFVLVMVGILVVKVRGFATRGREAGPWIHRLQIASAAGITLVGLALCWSAVAIGSIP